MLDDGELLLKWKRGEAGAGDLLVQRHFESVRRFFVNKAGHSADDLIQQTFIRCVEGRERFEGRSSFRTFILGIARYVLYEYLRQKARSEVIDFGVTSVQAIDPSPSQLIAGDQAKQAVAIALRGIPIDQQLAIELYYWENLSVEELAQILDIPTGTVKSRLYYARRALHRVLGHAADLGR